ncbi:MULTISPECIES: IS630 family transposase [unclassified Nocardiopsis]|uniref:IS630 family transposase n=1 Tax=Nocardiopsis TaxID=2013 RepID=UPI00387A857C
MRKRSTGGAPRCGPGPKEDAETSGAWVVFADECGASTSPPTRRTWGRRGRTPLVAARRGRRERANTVGWLCVHPATGAVKLFHAVRTRSSITAAVLPALLDRLHRALQGPVVLIWDNHSSHSGKRMIAQITARDWVRVVFLPRYAPELNPVETLWAHLKRVLRSRLFRSLEDLERVINAHLRLVRKRTDLLRGFIESVGLEPSPFPSTA